MKRTPEPVQSVLDRKRIAMVIALVAALGAIAFGLSRWGGGTRASIENDGPSRVLGDGGPGPRGADGGHIDLLPAGPAALRGTVVDASADPVAGVQITVSPERGSD